MKIEKTAAIFLGISVFAASSGLTSAFLSAYPQELKNVVTSGTVNIKLTEPDWDPKDARELTPKDSVLKNPMVTNTGKNDAWIFLKVSVPVKTISVVNEDSGRKMPAEKTELLIFTENDSWELMERIEETDAVSYVYGYKKIVKPQETTDPLFDEVTLVNYLEGEILAQEVLHMPVKADAVQDHICPVGASLREIYQTYSKVTQK